MKHDMRPGLGFLLLLENAHEKDLTKHFTIYISFFYFQKEYCGSFASFVQQVEFFSRVVYFLSKLLAYWNTPYQTILEEMFSSSCAMVFKTARIRVASDKNFRI